MTVPVVLLAISVAGSVYANDVIDGLAEPACTLDVLHSVALQPAQPGIMKLSGCLRSGPARGALPLVSLSIYGAISDELGILSSGQYRHVSGENFMVSDIVNPNLEFELEFNGSKDDHANNTALFELKYM